MTFGRTRSIIRNTSVFPDFAGCINRLSTRAGGGICRRCRYEDEPFWEEGRPLSRGAPGRGRGASGEEGAPPLGRREGTGGLTPRPSSPPPPRSPPAPPRPGAKVCPRWLVLGRECASVCPEGARPRQGWRLGHVGPFPSDRAGWGGPCPPSLNCRPACETELGGSGAGLGAGDSGHPVGGTWAARGVAGWGRGLGVSGRTLEEPEPNPGGLSFPGVSGRGRVLALG